MHKFFTIKSLQVLYDSLIHWLDVKWYWVAKTLVECSLVYLHEGVQYNFNKQKDLPIYFGKVRVPSCKPFRTSC